MDGQGDVRLIRDFLEEHVLKKERITKNLEEDLRFKVHFLDNQTRRKKYDLRPSKRKRLSAREKKKLELFRLKSHEQKYDMYVPLHDLWKDYLRDLISIDRMSSTNQTEVENRLMKADYHGAMVTVTATTCPSLIGCSGIVVMETKNTFKIISKDDKLRTVPKQGVVFTLELDGYTFTLYGSQFKFKASERATKKFKYKPTVDL